MPDTRNWLQVLTLFLTIIFSRSLLMSANTGLLSGSCFQHCSIRPYLVGSTDGQLGHSKGCPIIAAAPSTVPWARRALFLNPKAISASLTSFSEPGQDLGVPGAVEQHLVSLLSLERDLSSLPFHRYGKTADRMPYPLWWLREQHQSFKLLGSVNWLQKQTKLLPITPLSGAFLTSSFPWVAGIVAGPQGLPGGCAPGQLAASPGHPGRCHLLTPALPHLALSQARGRHKTDFVE